MVREIKRFRGLISATSKLYDRMIDEKYMRLEKKAGLAFFKSEYLDFYITIIYGDRDKLFETDSFYNVTVERKNLKGKCEEVMICYRQKDPNVVYEMLKSIKDCQTNVA
jgi:hypothetical protein